MQIKRVAVIGGGTMGKQIALNCAIYGKEVFLCDSFPGVLERVSSWKDEYLQSRISKGRLTQEQVEQAKANLALTESLERAVMQADLVIEAIVEKKQEKLDLFQKLCKLVPEDTILVSNSSTYVPSTFAMVCKNPGKVANLHYFNPALQMKLVEVVAHPQVAQDTLDSLMAFCTETGKTPILIKKELEGFVVNNILAAVNKVAWDLLEQEYASAQDIDRAAELGLGYPMGPFKLADMIGLDVTLDVRQARYEASGRLEDKPCELLKEMVARGELGRKSGKGFYEYQK